MKSEVMKDLTYFLLSPSWRRMKQNHFVSVLTRCFCLYLLLLNSCCHVFQRLWWREMSFYFLAHWRMIEWLILYWYRERSIFPLDECLYFFMIKSNILLECFWLENKSDACLVKHVFAVSDLKLFSGYKYIKYIQIWSFTQMHSFSFRENSFLSCCKKKM